jgi:hypothetical protein
MVWVFLSSHYIKPGGFSFLSGIVFYRIARVVYTAGQAVTIWSDEMTKKNQSFPYMQDWTS